MPARCSGPFGLGRLAGRLPWVDLFTLTNVGAIERIAAFGVVALMFTIGLELSFERLKSLRRLVFGLGLAQMVVGAALIARHGGADRRAAGGGDSFSAPRCRCPRRRSSCPCSPNTS